MIKKFDFLPWLLQVVTGISIVLLMLWIGKIISSYTNNFLSGSIIGMLLLTLSLQVRIVKLRWVAYIGNLFQRWTSLFFVPIGVGLVEHIPLLKSIFPAIVVTCIMSTLVLLVIVGHGTQWLERHELAGKPGAGKSGNGELKDE
jgi:holin-like protein